MKYAALLMMAVLPLVTPAERLEPGEYVITNMGGQSGFLFGIDSQ